MIGKVFITFVLSLAAMCAFLALVALFALISAVLFVIGPVWSIAILVAFSIIFVFTWRKLVSND